MINFVTVTKEKICEFILKANEKIIIAKPSYTEREILTILNVIKERNITCKLYIESGDKPIRYGFGETEAIKMIKKNLDILDAQTVGRIRLSIIVVDNESLIYGQDILFMEEETRYTTFPNGLYCDKEVTQLILNEIYYKNEKSIINKEKLLKNKKVKLFPTCKMTQGNKKEVKTDLENTIKSLEISPQVDPCELRKINFYRNEYKLVKITKQGINIKNRTLNLKPFLNLLTNISKHSKRSWTIFKPEDIQNLENMKLFEEEFKKITSQHLDKVGRFGYIIKVKDKSKFEKDISKIEKDFLDFVQGKDQDNKNNIFFKRKSDFYKQNKNNMKQNVKILLKNSKAELLKELMETSKSDDGFIENMLKRDRYLENQIYNEEMTKECARRKFIEKFIDNDLKFPYVEELINKIHINIDYYDISDELLNENKDFKAIIEKLKIEPREYEEGYV